MLIRRATVEDVAALARLHVDAWRTGYSGLVPDTVLQRMTYEWRADRLRQFMASGGADTYLMEAGGEVLGMLNVGACRDADLEGRETGEIWGIYVAPEHWRRGVGRRFVQVAENLLAARGHRQATLWVLEGNTAARRFYEAMGFHLDTTPGSTKTIDLDGPLPAVRYRKGLPSLKAVAMPKSGPLPPIRHRTYIQSPPGRVYDTLSSSAGWDAWFTKGSEVDARPGGWIHLRWADFGPDRVAAQDGGPVLQALPSQRLVFQWSPGEALTTVSLDLEPRGPGTVLTVTEWGHTGSEQDLAALVDCAAGWGEALTLLRVYLEHGIRYEVVPGAEDNG